MKIYDNRVKYGRYLTKNAKFAAETPKCTQKGTPVHRCLTYIIVLQVLEQGDLSDGCAGCPLLVLKPNLLQSNQVVSQTTLTLEHRGVSPLK